MKKYTVIGLTESKSCCLLESLLEWDNLDFENLESSDFKHNSTNWGGSDDLVRTLELRNLKLTGRSKVLNKPLVFRGTDYDCGKIYDWSSKILKILEVEHD